ncbi:hypothetical protein DASC09_021680 [Saccharomycopsis crataegensis]|uniref:Uncharacterized protein n=1 Tax=Saccharomycopsis crataegensis TaxID=43959 RepID=A0AAV5QKZ1_9ASCO|nr:hypothetical protein DASC09_021680 [Saccharomycopsis crataegensis]
MLRATAVSSAAGGGSSSDGQSYTQESMDDIGFQSMVPNNLKKIHPVASEPLLNGHRLKRSTTELFAKVESAHNRGDDSSLCDITENVLNSDPFHGKLLPSTNKSSRRSSTIGLFGKENANKEVRFSASEGFPISHNSSTTIPSLNKITDAAVDISSESSPRNFAKISRSSRIPVNARNFSDKQYTNVSNDFVVRKNTPDNIPWHPLSTRRQQNSITMLEPQATLQPSKNKEPQKELKYQLEHEILNNLDTLFLIFSSVRKSVNEDELREIEHCIDRIRDQINNLVASLDSKFVEKVMDIEQTNVKLKKENSLLQDLCNVLKSEYTKASAEITRLKDQTQKFHNQIDCLTAEKNKMSEKFYLNAEDFQEAMTLMFENPDEKIESKKFMGKLRRLIDSFNFANKKNEIMQQENNKLQTKLDTFGNESSENLKTIDFMENHIKKQEETIKQLTDKYGLLENEKNETEGTLKVKEEELGKLINRMENDRKTFHDNASDMKESLRKKDVQVAEAWKMLSTFASSNTTNAAKLVSLEEENRKHHETEDFWKEKVREYKHINQALEKDGMLKQERITEEQKLCQSLKLKILELESNEKETQATNEKLIDEVRVTQMRVEELKSENISLLNKFKKMTEKSGRIETACGVGKFYFEDLSNSAIIKLEKIIDERSFARVKRKLQDISQIKLYDDSIMPKLEHITRFVLQSIDCIIQEVQKMRNRNSRLEADIRSLESGPQEQNSKIKNN